jgi:hypothetical protein
MKKRKPPIVAITILVVCIVVAAGFNYKWGVDPKAVPTEVPAAPTSEIQLGKPRKTQTADQIANQVKQQAGTLNSTPKTPAQGRGKMGPAGRIPVGNSIETSSLHPSKPVPNDSSVSSQWYESDSNRSGN